jgi:hypothetical protein
MTHLYLRVQTDPDGSERPTLYTAQSDRPLARGDLIAFADPIGRLTVQHAEPGFADVGTVHVSNDQIGRLSDLGWHRVRS